jgi:hypothetical protein
MVTGRKSATERGGLSATVQEDSVRWQGEVHDGYHYRLLLVTRTDDGRGP